MSLLLLKLSMSLSNVEDSVPEIKLCPMILSALHHGYKHIVDIACTQKKLLATSAEEKWSTVVRIVIVHNTCNNITHKDREFNFN